MEIHNWSTSNCWLLKCLLPDVPCHLPFCKGLLSLQAIDLVWTPCNQVPVLILTSTFRHSPPLPRLPQGYFRSPGNDYCKVWNRDSLQFSVGLDSLNNLMPSLIRYGGQIPLVTWETELLEIQMKVCFLPLCLIPALHSGSQLASY